MRKLAEKCGSFQPFSAAGGAVVFGMAFNMALLANGRQRLGAGRLC
jgi:hypothetical protein